MVVVGVVMACATLSAVPVTAASELQGTISGPAVVVDGDTLDIAGVRVRLEGIDAPEMSQICLDARGKSWSCGRAARDALAQATAGQAVMCDRTGMDKYGRSLAICFANGEDLNAALVVAGLARAFVKYSNRYEALEAEARTRHAGLWQADNMAPWDYRHQRWQMAEATAPAGCAIKGNISSRGRIYHAPWSAWYAKVKVDPAHGERWFCSESEALAAGFRPAQQL